MIAFVVFLIGVTLGFLGAAMMFAASRSEWERMYLQELIEQEKKTGKWKN